MIFIHHISNSISNNYYLAYSTITAQFNLGPPKQLFVITLSFFNKTISGYTIFINQQIIHIIYSLFT